MFMNCTIHGTIHNSKFKLSDTRYDSRFNYHDYFILEHLSLYWNIGCWGCYFFFLFCSLHCSVCGDVYWWWQFWEIQMFVQCLYLSVNPRFKIIAKRVCKLLIL